MKYTENEITVITGFITKNSSTLKFVEDYLETIPDSRIPRTVLDLFCNCGEYKKINKLHIASYCGNSACWMHYGKKRPAHSKLMKTLAMTTNKLTGLFKKGQTHNKELNTDQFKIKILQNKNIPIFDLDKQYSEYQRNKSFSSKGKSYETKLKSVPNKLKDIIYKKYGNIELTTEYFNTLDIVEKDKLFFDIHGLLTRHYDFKIRKARGTKFKRILVKNLEYNKKVSAVICKSTLELKWIKFFEKHSILWEYEPFTVAGKIRGSYTPDFLIEYNNKKIVLEVKGTLYGYPVDYMENKIQGCIEYCDANNYEFKFKMGNQITL